MMKTIPGPGLRLSVFTPAAAEEHKGTARLARSLSTARDDDSSEAEDELMSSAAMFAREFRNRQEPPERLVIALKELFAHLDGRTPSLAEATTDRVEALANQSCRKWYARVLTGCLDAYFDAEELT